MSAGCVQASDCPPMGAGHRAACCDGKCLDVGTDAKNCGACGNACGSKSCCGGSCVDVQTSAFNCGACGQSCMAPHARSTCAAGACGLGACNSGWGDCNKDPKDGCETSLHTDVNNCGMCGMVCAIPNAVAGCADGCYLAACQYGFADCNMDPKDGCEQSVSNDANNCGGCGMKCGAVPNGQASCVNASCQLASCNPGFLDCDHNPANGCEVAVATDTNNCGACGNICPMGNVCKGGACTCPMCNIPNASAKCINNQCVFDRCNPGYTDCNMNLQDGCEAYTDGDPKNCGGCGIVCPQNLPGCLAGQCVMSPCLGNPQWTRVTCTTPDWVWSSDRNKAQTVPAAAAAHVLETGCNHAGPQPLEGMGMCSLDGKGWVSTKTFPMTTCDQAFWHLGGRYTGACGGHNGDTYRHLALTDSDCYPY